MVNAGIAQAMALTEALGLDPTLFLQAVDGGPLDSPNLHVKGATVAAQSWQPVSFALDGVRKDVSLMVEAAHGAGLPDDLLRALLAVYDRSGEPGHGGDDMAAVRTAFDAL